MKNTRKNRSNWSSNTKRFRKLMVTSLLGFSVVPIFATTTSLGFTQTSKVSSLFKNEFDGGGLRPSGFGVGFVSGFLATMITKIAEKLEDVGSKVSAAHSSFSKKNFSNVRYRLDQIWSKIEEVEAEIEKYTGEVRQLTDPIARLELLEKRIEWRLLLLEHRNSAVELEIQLAAAM